MATTRRIALLFLAAGMVSSLPSTASPPDPFVGGYVSVDPVDGSYQRLALGGGGSSLTVDYDGRCSNGDTFAAVVTYTVVGDGLTDDFGTDWQRP